jgi:site-specific recombinase XerD
MWLRYGGGLRQLQAIMRHKHIETTMIYVQLAGHDVLKEHARHSPVRTLGLVD